MSTGVAKKMRHSILHSGIVSLIAELTITIA
jgi:hypothetical protein